jgi:peptidoglycan L-alanyl-D-glutamate endopeptidase CwlK
MNNTSLNRLQLVHPDLQQVILTASQRHPYEFIVTEGERTLEKQRQYYESGASKTMKSRHVPASNSCGKSCAVDLAVIIAGEVRWDGNLYTSLAYTVRDAAIEHDIPVVWGGCWEVLNDVESIEEAQFQYIKRKRNRGQKAFIDGPHFELSWGAYP